MIRTCDMLAYGVHTAYDCRLTFLLIALALDATLLYPILWLLFDP